MSWLIYAFASAVAAAATAILAKIGVEGVPSTLATAFRTTIVLIIAWLMVLAPMGVKNRVTDETASSGSLAVTEIVVVGGPRHTSGAMLVGLAVRFERLGGVLSAGAHCVYATYRPSPEIDGCQPAMGFPPLSIETADVTLVWRSQTRTYGVVVEASASAITVPDGRPIEGRSAAPSRVGTAASSAAPVSTVAQRATFWRRTEATSDGTSPALGSGSPHRR